MNSNMNAAAQNINMNAFGSQGPQLSDEQLRQMMLGLPPSSTPNNTNSGGAPPNPFAGFSGMEGMGGPGMAGMEEDPMMKIMQQLLGAGGGGGMPNLSEGFSGMSSSFTGPSTTTSTDPYAYIWRIIHAIFALSLGLYITFTTSFTGTKFEREQSIYNSKGRDPLSDDFYGGVMKGETIKVFWIFATMEILLQTSRFFFDRGAIQHAGWLGMVVGFLPEPWKGYVAVLSRYARIWTTLRTDIMTLVFVLGVCAWWKG